MPQLRVFLLQREHDSTNNVTDYCADSHNRSDEAEAIYFPWSPLYWQAINKGCKTKEVEANKFPEVLVAFQQDAYMDFIFLTNVPSKVSVRACV
jgi:hypothetical protein